MAHPPDMPQLQHDPATRGGDAPDGRKVKATLHWVSAAHAVPARVRLVDRLFTVENPNVTPEGGSFLEHLNPEALQVIEGALLEPALAEQPAGWRCQFERLGYFCVDPASGETPVYNRIVSLRDTWARVKGR